MSDDRPAGPPRDDLGIGEAKGPARRLLAKVLWPFLRHQVAVNGALRQELDALRGRLAELEGEVGRARSDLDHHGSVLVRHEEPLDRHEFLLSHLEPAFLDLQRAVDLVHDKVDLGQRQAFARYHEGIGPLQRSIGELAQRLADLELAEEDRQSGWRAALSDVGLRLGQLDLFLTEARRAFPAPPAPEALAGVPSGFEALRSAFEEALAGPSPLVESRARTYVPDLSGLSCGGPVVDLGCGRGELLGVLAEAGVEAYGVDASPAQVARCAERGLAARQGDARAHLASLEERSVAAVTALHLVDHLGPDELLEVLGLAARAIRPGGLLVLESPNPENLVVAATTAAVDPARRPVAPELLAFLVGSRGFDPVEVRRLARPDQARPLAGPKPDEAGETLSGLVEAVNAHLFAPADYAVLARRP